MTPSELARYHCQKGVVDDNVVSSKDNVNMMNGLDLIILAGIKHGQGKDGVDMGAQKLYESLGVSSPITIDINDVIDNKEQEKEEEEGKAELIKPINIKSNQKVPIRNPTQVASYNLQLYNVIHAKGIEYMKTFKSMPKILTLGGDHSLAMGSIAAISNLCKEAILETKRNSTTTISTSTSTSSLSLSFTDPNLIVFWIDAHADLNTPAGTLSGNLHGCPVSFLAGLDKEGWSELKVFDQLINKSVDGKFLNVKNLVYIGLRDVDEFENEIIQREQLIQFSMEKILKEKLEMKEIVQQVLNKIDPQGKCPIHISFDIDGLDPTFAPSTGTPVKGGLTFEQGIELITTIKSTGRMISIDLVEVNPMIGSSEDVKKTLEAGRQLIKAFSS